MFLQIGGQTVDLRGRLRWISQLEPAFRSTQAVDNIVAKLFHFSMMLTAPGANVQAGDSSACRPGSSTLLPITRHDPIAQYFIRCFHGVAIDDEFLWARILSDEL